MQSVYINTSLVLHCNTYNVKLSRREVKVQRSAIPESTLTVVHMCISITKQLWCSFEPFVLVIYFALSVSVS